MKIPQRMLTILSITRHVIVAIHNIRVEYIKSAKLPSDALIAAIQLEAIKRFTEAQLHLLLSTQIYAPLDGGRIITICNESGPVNIDDMYKVIKLSAKRSN
jgi:hypothetical protein